MAAVDQADHRGAGYEPACGHRRGLHGGDHRAGAFSRDWRAASAVIPAVQAAAVAAGGFVAGAAVVGLVNRLHRNAAAARPQSGGERGWILETNTAMNRGMEAMGGRIVKRYRVYERPLRPLDGA